MNTIPYTFSMCIRITTKTVPTQVTILLLFKRYDRFLPRYVTFTNGKYSTSRCLLCCRGLCACGPCVLYSVICCYYSYLEKYQKNIIPSRRQRNRNRTERPPRRFRSALRNLFRYDQNAEAFIFTVNDSRFKFCRVPGSNRKRPKTYASATEYVFLANL